MARPEDSELEERKSRGVTESPGALFDSSFVVHGNRLTGCTILNLKLPQWTGGDRDSSGPSRVRPDSDSESSGTRDAHACTKSSSPALVDGREFDEDASQMHTRAVQHPRPAHSEPFGAIAPKAPDAHASMRCSVWLHRLHGLLRRNRSRSQLGRNYKRKVSPSCRMATRGSYIAIALGSANHAELQRAHVLAELLACLFHVGTHPLIEARAANRRGNFAAENIEPYKNRAQRPSVSAPHAARMLLVQTFGELNHLVLRTKLHHAKTDRRRTQARKEFQIRKSTRTHTQRRTLSACAVVP